MTTAAPTPPADLPPIPPPSIERADLPLLGVVAQLAALLALADDAVTSIQAHREAAHLVCRADREARVAAADDLDREAGTLRGSAAEPMARHKRAAAAFLRGLDRPGAP